MNGFVKALLIFLSGLAMGALLYSTFAQLEPNSSISPAPNIKSSAQKAQVSPENDALRKEISQLQQELAELKKERDIAFKDELQIENVNVTERDFGALTDEFDKQLPEKLAVIAQQRLEELKNTQSSELDEIFPSNDEEMKSHIESDYKQHLTQEKEPSWSTQAEDFLRNHFYSQTTEKFRLIRVDCRTNSCEVAGLLDVGLMPVGNSAERESTSEMSSSVFAEEEQLLNRLKSSPSFVKIFGQGIVRPASFLPEDVKKSPAAYSFFVQKG